VADDFQTDGLGEDPHAHAAAARAMAAWAAAVNDLGKAPFLRGGHLDATVVKLGFSHDKNVAL
jgi:hypothetical protein